MIEAKLRAARTRGYYRSVDLFAGCGGMTLGFHRAGFRCVASVEHNEHARASHSMNFAGLVPAGEYRAHGDITALAPIDAVRHLSPLFPDPEASIDIVIGGPPCQAFSRLGRAALWDLAGQKHAHGQDERATMYEHFLRYVVDLKPLAFVIENVREIGKFVGRNVAEEIAATGEELGYEVRYTILNATWYGVPQLRERLFLVGIHKGLGCVPEFPPIERTCELPVGYSTARSGRGHQQVLPPDDHFVDHAKRRRRTTPSVTAQEAFSDLPPIFHHLDGRAGKGVPRDPDKPSEYQGRGSAFSQEMRSWPGFETNGAFSGHVIRYTPRDYETFRRMPHGGMYPEALAVAEEIFVERLAEAEQRLGHRIESTDPVWGEIRKATVPPYKSHRYPNKFRKMHPNRPARTVPAHIGKDAYSHIHYDSDQARGISLREAARLQSFPDAFRLQGSMNQRLVQIGNAVPPLLAYALAKTLANQFAPRVRQSRPPGPARRSFGRPASTAPVSEPHREASVQAVSPK